MYCVTLWGACFLHFLQKLFLALGMFTCDVEKEGAIVSACAYGGRAHLAGKSQALIGKPLDRRPKRDARGVDDRRDVLETRRRGRITHGLVTHHLYRSPSVWAARGSAPLRGRGEARERCFWAGSKTSFDYFHHICSRSSHDLYTICHALYTQLMVRINYFI